MSLHYERRRCKTAEEIGGEKILRFIKGGKGTVLDFKSYGRWATSFLRINERKDLIGENDEY